MMTIDNVPAFMPHNFTHLDLQHQDDISYCQSASTAPTATPPAMIQLLGLDEVAVIFEMCLDFYQAIFVMRWLMRWDEQ